MALADLRKEYALGGLRRADLSLDPIDQFRSWFDDASNAHGHGRVRKFFAHMYKALLQLSGEAVPDVNAMTLATADSEGRPSARIVLLKGVDQRGFIFFTNYESRKGQELTANPHASVAFYWPDLERQVCVRGTVVKLPEAESETYFASRPRGSRIGAWASRQSQEVVNREQLEKQWQHFESQYPGEAVPKPAHWGGYILQPEELEFWQGRPSRLHDRFIYRRAAGGVWGIHRLCP